MSNVVISNRSIFNQKINNIDSNKVALVFDVTKVQFEKLKNLLEKAKISFVQESDKLSINNLSLNGVQAKNNEREFFTSNMTLSKTYVVTMKRNFITSVKLFYDKILKPNESPVFNIEHENNLQRALAEATMEIDLSSLNASMQQQEKLPESTIQVQQQDVINNNFMQTPQQSEVPTTQVIANDPLVNSDKIIENPISPMTINGQQTVVNQTPVQENVANDGMNQQVTGQPNVMDQQMNNLRQEVTKPKRRFLARKGNILVIPVVILWLGLVLFGTIKLVTNMLT